MSPDRPETSEPQAGTPRLLTGEQRELLRSIRETLTTLGEILGRFDGSPEDRETLRGTLGHLDELFLLVVAGEFNAGKSAFINALVGTDLLKVGATPTTSRLHLVLHEDNAGGTAPAGVEVVTSRAPLLRHLDIVDTPGTNAIQREHEALTRDFIPRADMVLFVTSADRPFTESERTFLESIRNWGKKVVVVVNKLDIIFEPADVERILQFVTENASRLLGVAPGVFVLSARQAFEARRSEEVDRELLAASGFEALESFLVSTLDEAERVRLKLASPVGVGRHLAEGYLEVARDRAGLLREDVKALEDVERQIEVYREDMHREFRFRLADVDNALLDFERRGMEFFDDTLRLGRIFDLLSPARVKADFEQRVVADLPQVVEKRVGEIIDWMVGSELRLWHGVNDHVEKRRERHADRILGPSGKGFDYDRSRLLDTLGRSAQKTVETYDRREEAQRMAESVKLAVAGTALVEVGAVGLGAVVTALATTSTVDVTGLLAAGAMAAVGLVILPARKRATQKELRQRIAELREQLMSGLTTEFEREIERGLERIQQAIAPYTRFIRAERSHLEAMEGELRSILEHLDRLSSRIESLS